MVALILLKLISIVSLDIHSRALGTVCSSISSSSASTFVGGTDHSAFVGGPRFAAGYLTGDSLWRTWLFLDLLEVVRSLVHEGKTIWYWVRMCILISTAWTHHRAGLLSIDHCLTGELPLIEWLERFWALELLLVKALVLVHERCGVMVWSKEIARWVWLVFFANVLLHSANWVIMPPAHGIALIDSYLVGSSSLSHYVAR